MPRRSTLLILFCSLSVAAPRTPGAAPPSKPRLDAHGHPLPAGAVARLGTVRWRHAGDAEALAFAPDGKTLWGAGRDGTVRAWEVPSGRAVFHSRWPVGRCKCVLFSPDAKQLAYVAHDGAVALRAVATGKVVRTIPSRGRAPSPAFTFSGDWGRLAMIGADGKVHVWDVGTGKHVRALEPGPKERWHVALSKDGRFLATAAAEESIQVWDVNTGKQTRLVDPRPAPAEKGFSVRQFEFTRDGSALVVNAAAAGWRVYDLRSGRLVRGLDAVGWGCTPSPDGRTAAFHHGHDVYLCDLNTGKVRWKWAGGAWSTLGAAFSADGKSFAAANTGGVVRYWDVATGKEHSSAVGFGAGVRALAFAPDGKVLAAGGHDGTIYLGGPRGGKGRRLAAGPGDCRGLAFSPDGKLLASVGEHTALLQHSAVCLWDVASGRRRSVIPQRAPGCVCFTRDGQQVVTAQQASPFFGSTFMPPELDEDGVAVWRVANGSKVRRLRNASSTSGGGPSLALSSDGLLLALCYAGACELWDLTGGARLAVVGKTGDWSGQCALSPDGRTLAAVHAKSWAYVGDLAGGITEPGIHLVETASGKTRRVLPGQSTYWRIAYSPDGRSLAVGKENGTVELIDLTGAAPNRVWKGHTGSVYALAFAPDGKTLASGSEDTTALLWEVPAWPRAPRPAALAARQLAALWGDLADADAARADRAVRRLAASPDQAVALLKKRLAPAAGPSAGAVRRLLADLDSDDFATRERATAKLKPLAPTLAPELRQEAAKTSSPEVRARLRRALDGVKFGLCPPGELRGVRAVEVLEAVGTPEARRLLKELAAGSPAALLTRHARAARDRLNGPRHPTQELLP